MCLQAEPVLHPSAFCTTERRPVRTMRGRVELARRPICLQAELVRRIQGSAICMCQTEYAGCDVECRGVEHHPRELLFYVPRCPMIHGAAHTQTQACRESSCTMYHALSLVWL